MKIFRRTQTRLRGPAGDSPASVFGRRSAAHRRGWRSASRRGAAIIEFALIAPLFFLLVIGIIEFGRALMVQQVLTNASREGSRRAIVEGATVSDVQNVVTTYLSNASISSSTVTVSPNPLTNVGFGDPVTVTVTVPFSNVSWMSNPWFLGGRTLKAVSVMRGERLQ
ncbi:MAG TPA: TadE family protein [Planctomycetaceae bacterium]|nr:TadE family protein [Planctomycetaceae bacterium]